MRITPSCPSVGADATPTTSAAPCPTALQLSMSIAAVEAARSLEGSEVPNGGSVRFTDAPADRGTEVHVDLHHDPPAGSAGAIVAKLFGEEPGQQLRDDLRRFKQVMETGEVVRSDGSLEGAGQGAAKQRPAQAAEAAVRS
jgi:uncharacterized membrane protein